MNIHAVFWCFAEQTGDQEMFVDFDRLSPAVCVSVLIAGCFSLLIQSGSSVPV